LIFSRRGGAIFGYRILFLFVVIFADIKCFFSF